MRDVAKAATGHMITAAVLGIVLGALMLLYPGGTVVLMQSAFVVFKWILSIFILCWALILAVGFFRVRATMTGVGYLALGVLAVILIWSLGLGIVYIVVSAFLFVSGIGEIASSFRPDGTFFLTLLGLIDIIVGILVVTNPLILPLLIAWYVLFWGISRMLLALELRRLLSA